ncbi:MBL fold metallo-hydrolase [Paenarthrobacter sp. RAF54_2]|uniref:MBL fold metallo-hydrolase n=1 Tax=Micrococcaceae TaxID=1268 RepID=UPI003F90C92B
MSESKDPGLTPQVNEVVVLGSAGGPTPKSGRRPVSHALVIDEDVTLVDCGNGTVSQFVSAGLDLGRLRRILISHHHIDHVADVAMLLHLAWSQLKAPVHVIGPPPLARLFALHYEAFDFDIRSRMNDEGRPHLREFVRVQEITGPETIDDGSTTITAVLVDHPPVEHAFGYRIDQGGLSVCFSGDTRPSEAITSLARGADLLIHETTYLTNATDYLSAERAARVLPRMRSVHSDPRGAAHVAAEAGSRELLLSPVGTFGPASDDEILAEAAGEFTGRTRVGSDFLRIPLS